MQLRNRGVAMLAALLFLVVASGIITLMFTSTLSEIRQSGDSAAIVKSLSLARGGANLGARLLNDDVRDELQTLVLASADTGERFPFGNALNISDPAPTPETVINDLANVTADLQVQIDRLVCGQVVRPKSAHALRVWIYVTDTACEGLPSEKPLNSSVELPAARYVGLRRYSLPFVLVSEAVVGGYEREIMSQGEYQFVVGGGKFSQYALFTDEHVDTNGDPVWFTSDTLYDGRVHTNTTFRFAFEPWFGGEVTSLGCTTTTFVPHPTQPNRQIEVCTAEQPGASFLSEGLNSFKDLADFNSPTSPSVGSDKPAFNAGVDWQAGFVALPDDALDQHRAALSEGLLISNSLYSLTLFAGGNTDSPLASNGNGGWTPAASYQYIEACETATQCDTYRYGPDKELYQKTVNGSGVVTWVSRLPKFNGVVYVEGEVERFTGPARVDPNTNVVNPNSIDAADAPPALASFAALTVVPEDELFITGDLKYETPPCVGKLERSNNVVTQATCNNLNVKNILGVYAPNKNISVGNGNLDATKNAPDNLSIQGSFMAANGIITAEEFNNKITRGTLDLLGGFIEQRYGPLGEFGSSGQTSGYQRSVTFDPRMALDYAPPFFPGTEPSMVQSVFVYSYGQREQTY